MAHTRIRKFNTRDAYPEQKLDNDLCQAVIAGNTIYLRGQVAQDLDTRQNVAVGDAAGQNEQVMQNIDTLLRECGSQLDHIVKATVYLTDIRYRDQGIEQSKYKDFCHRVDAQAHGGRYLLRMLSFA